MCIHERQLLLKSFLFNYYFYFFADLSRFHCYIGCSLFLSGTVYGIYATDLKNEGYSAYVYVSWCRT